MAQVEGGGGEAADGQQVGDGEEDEGGQAGDLGQAEAKEDQKAEAKAREGRENDN